MRAESTIRNNRVRSGALRAVSFAAMVIAGASAAYAQEAAPVGSDQQELDEVASEQDIIVTGSRIVRQDYEANSPIVTVGSELLEQSSTSAIESNLNKLPQFVPAQTPTAGADIQPTATNTPGAATVSLRGIGANRNLVLIDGRRSTPSNASGVTDISTIPQAAIERVEIISGGASATYGADAVAGVTNFILKKNFVGLELDGQIGITERGDNLEWQVAGIMGADFDDGRGNVSLAMSVNTRESSFQRDRPWYRDLFNDPSVGGTAFFNSAPGIILSFANPANQTVIQSLFPTANPPVTGGAGYNLFANPDGTLWTGTGFAQRGGTSRFNTAPLDGNPWKLTDIGTIGFNNTNLYLILPLTRYNALARGNYEINDWIGVFGSAQFSKVNTYTRNEPGPITNGWDVFLPYGTGVYVGSQRPQSNGQVLGTGNISSVILNGQLNGFVPYVDPTPNVLTDNPTNPAFRSLYGSQYACANNATGGCTNNQVLGSLLPAEVQTVLNSRVDPNAPFQLTSYMPDDRETFTDVVTFNITAGVEGRIPETDWTWELFASHGESHTFARQTGIYSLERVQTVLSSPGFGRGFSVTGNPESNFFGASTGTCTSGVNFFNVPSGGFSNDCLEAMRADLKNRSKFRQTIWEGNLSGSLFDLPAGAVGAAVGASYREQDYEFINDTLTTQGRSFLDQALGIYPSGNAFGSITSTDFYGELLIPVLADIPGIKKFSLELGGRISDYNTTGTSYTYKILGDWEVLDWLRFRGGYNRAERAPNIGELFLSAQQTFGVNGAGDVCSTLNPNSYSANPALNSGGTTGARQVQAVCRALMQQAGPDAIAQYYGPAAPPQSPAGFGFAFPTLIGNANLSPETADTWTAGVVIQSPFDEPALSRLRLSVDFYDITVKDAIGAQTIAAVQRQCYDPQFNAALTGADFAGDSVGTGAPNAQAVTAAANPFCQLVPRNGTGQLGNVKITYTNDGRVHLQGIDAQLDWGVDVGPGTFTINSLFNYQIDFESSALYPALPLVDYVGTQGTGENGLNANVFEYRFFTTVGYSWGGARVAVQWQYYPSIEDGGEALTVGGTPNTAGYPDYHLFSLNGTYAVTRDITFRFGIDNLFDKEPPLGGFNPNADNSLGQLRGGTYLGAVHDTNGRRYYAGITAKF